MIGRLAQAQLGTELTKIEDALTHPKHTWLKSHFDFAGKIGDKTIPLTFGRKASTIFISSMYGLVLLLFIKWVFDVSELLWLIGVLPAAMLIFVSSTLSTESTNTKTVLRRCQLLSLIIGLLLVSGQLVSIVS